MSVLINIENYEIYYLDYLEGNLNEEQTRAFLAFLEQHPELKMEDESLTILWENTEDKLDPITKTLFKVELSTEVITEETVENFMIAAIEKQLSNQQEKALQTFIQKYPSYQADFEWYKKSILPTEQIVYPAKSSLRKGGIVVPMYYKAIAIAASLILVLLFIRNYNNSRLIDPNKQIAKTHQTTRKEINASKKNEVRTDNLEEIQQVNPVQVASQHDIQQKGKVYSPEKSANFKVNNGLKTKSLQTIPSENNNLVLAELNVNAPTNFVSEVETDFASEANNSYLSVKEMNAPIYLISKEIKERFNKEVDFRSAKATKTKQGGFYLKIGKIEITRKKKPVESVLASN